MLGAGERLFRRDQRQEMLAARRHPDRRRRHRHPYLRGHPRRRAGVGRRRQSAQARGRSPPSGHPADRLQTSKRQQRLEHHSAQPGAPRLAERSWPASSRFARGAGVAAGARAGRPFRSAAQTLATTPESGHQSTAGLGLEPGTPRSSVVCAEPLRRSSSTSALAGQDRIRSCPLSRVFGRAVRRDCALGVLRSSASLELSSPRPPLAPRTVVVSVRTDRSDVVARTERGSVSVSDFVTAVRLLYGRMVRVKLASMTAVGMRVLTMMVSALNRRVWMMAPSGPKLGPGEARIALPWMGSPV